MEIVSDEPGRRLVVDETASRMPLAILGAGLVLVVLLAAPWRGLWAVVAHGAPLESVDLAGSAVWLILGSLLLLSLRGGSRIEGITADREGGVVVRSSHVAGFIRWTQRVPPDAIEGFTLDVAPSPGGSLQHPSGPARPLPLRLTLRAGGRRRKPIPLRVLQVERSSEVADLALRAGAAVGLRYFRVVASDAQQFEIELLRTAGPDAKTVPALGRRADDARDGVATPAVAAASDTARRFDPSTFEGKPPVTAWAPGRRVSFDKTWGAAILLSPLLAAALTGPLAWWRLPALHRMPLLPRVAALALITLAGLAVALIGWMGLTTSLPRRVTLDWETRSLVLDGARSRRSVPFSDIEAIEVRPRLYRGRRGQRQYTTYHWCEIRAALHPAEGPPVNELLAETRQYREDGVTPHAMAVPLARELAAALDLKVRETPAE
jgi:hypothetical protein